MTNEAIIKLAKENNGTITASEISKAGISRGHLNYALKNGLLERSSRGVYILPENFDDEMFGLQTRYKKGVFSCETALFLHGLTDRTPNRCCMSFPNSYNTSSPLSENVLCHRVSMPFYKIGIVQALTPFQNTVNVYCPEKTLCDILRPQYHVDIQLITEAFKAYVNSDKVNIPLLSEYANKLKVADRVRLYLEVLL